nr:MAG TPA: hypothetical protein [Caudoviricetes sp.]
MYEKLSIQKCMLFFIIKKYTYFEVEDSIVRFDGRSLSRSK